MGLLRDAAGRQRAAGDTRMKARAVIVVHVQASGPRIHVIQQRLACIRADVVFASHIDLRLLPAGKRAMTIQELDARPLHQLPIEDAVANDKAPHIPVNRGVLEDLVAQSGDVHASIALAGDVEWALLVIRKLCEERLQCRQIICRGGIIVQLLRIRRVIGVRIANAHGRLEIQNAGELVPGERVLVQDLAESVDQKRPVLIEETIHGRAPWASIHPEQKWRLRVGGLGLDQDIVQVLLAERQITGPPRRRKWTWPTWQ
mmetsp:Transcript_20411/g.59168  ORF Transcript_20411/g.59168 Transcript_20411/m.59168 type:complete len:259 (+) Transcript_20411:771-1547(+)